jgi:protein tyrosine/serine phosphatase
VRAPGGRRLGARTWLVELAGVVAPGPRIAGPGENTTSRAWAEAIERPGLPNLHRVTKTLYRGGQPTAEGIRELSALGVKRIVNLRAAHSDKDLLEGTGIDCVRVHCNAWHPEDEDVVAFLKALSDEAKGPFFVHCKHGADRTGMMIAVYRVVHEGWSKAEAIEEMTGEGFGHHEVWSGLVEYVRDFDVDAIRREAGLPARPLR